MTVEDGALAAAAAAGDERAFATLVERYRGYIHAIAWRIVLDEEEALDIAQETLIKLSRSIGQWQGRGSFRAWLGAIASRTALDQRRRPGRRERPTDPQSFPEPGAGRMVAMAATVRSPVELLVAEERREQVTAAMGRLTPQQRAIFQLRLGEEMLPGEIAERLGIPARQVRSQLSRAIARLREELAEEK